MRIRLYNLKINDEVWKKKCFSWLVVHCNLLQIDIILQKSLLNRMKLRMKLHESSHTKWKFCLKLKLVKCWIDFIIFLTLFDQKVKIEIWMNYFCLWFRVLKMVDFQYLLNFQYWFTPRNEQSVVRVIQKDTSFSFKIIFNKYSDSLVHL